MTLFMEHNFIQMAAATPAISGVSWRKFLDDTFA